MILACVGVLVIGQAPVFPKGKDPILILTYHDVITKRNKNSVWFDCTVDELNAQIKKLKLAGATFISIRDVANHMRNGMPLPKRSVAVTFADNYEGFYKHGWPILRRENIPVTMFVHTGHVGSQKGRPKMSWAMLQELGKNRLFTVGSQTVSHPADLTKLSAESLKREFDQSRTTLLQHVKSCYVDVIAYPNGKFDAKVAEQAKRSGYALGFTETQEPANIARNAWSVSRYVHTELSQGMRECFKVR